MAQDVALQKMMVTTQILEEKLQTKEETIFDLQVPHEVTLLSSSDTVMQLINDGESKAVISKKLGMPINKIELIVKFDKIKKREGK